MKSFLIAATLTLLVSCQNRLGRDIQKTNPGEDLVSEVMDFHVIRLSGSRVQLTWHATPNQNQNEFLVMRRLGRSGVFEKVGSIKPKQADAINDYTLTDTNDCEDSSYYSIMQTDIKGVKYFSASKGIKGMKRL